MIVPAMVVAISLAGSIYAPADSINIGAGMWWPLLLLTVAAAATALRGKTALLLAACYVAWGAMLFAPLAPAPMAARPPSTIRLVSYNMLRSSESADGAAEWIVRQDADFVVLLEAVPRHHRAIERLREVYPFAYSCSRRGYCSTMLFSRRPAADFWPHARGDADNRRALSALTARFDIDGRILPITAVHLNRPWPLGDQADQLADLADALATFGRRGVVAGDFNSAPWTFAMRRASGAGELRLASGGAGTWPSALPAFLRLPLDQVYLGTCMSPATVRQGPSLGSDHLPVVVDIAMGGCVA